MHSNTGQWGMLFVLTSAAVHWWLDHCTSVCLKNIQRCLCQWHYNAVNLFCRATQGSEECILSWPVLQCHWYWVTAHLCVWEISKGVFAVTLQCCQLGLQSNTGQSGMHFVLTSAAVHWWWDTAHLCVWEISKGVFAVTLQCCQPVLQSNTGQWGMHFVLTSAAVHLVLRHCTPIWWANTQRSLFVVTHNAVSLFCRETKGSEECILSWPVLHYTGIGSLHTCMMSRYLKVYLQWHKWAVSLFCRATQDSEECILSWPVLQCTGTGTLHTCMMSRNLKVSLQWH